MLRIVFYRTCPGSVFLFYNFLNPLAVDCFMCYVIKDTQIEDAFVRKTINSDFNRGDGLRQEELAIDLNELSRFMKFHF